MNNNNNNNNEIDSYMKNINNHNINEKKEEKSTTPILDNDVNDWICGICNSFEAPDDSNLILCDGPCNRSFHFYCIGFNPNEQFNDINDDTMNKWYCDHCKNNRHICFICGDEGNDNDEENGVLKCKHKNCGKFYHINCLEINNYQSLIIKNEEKETIINCPYHFCDTCHDSFGSGSQILSCQFCPKSFHRNCSPPDSLLYDFIYLCPEHIELANDLKIKDNKINSATSLESRATGVTFNLSIFSLIWCYDNLPKNHNINSNKILDNRHFRLPDSIYKSVNSRPPPYTRISNLKYLIKKEDNKNFKNFVNTKCICNNICDDNCYNRVGRVECSDINCDNGKNCTNRQIQLGKIPQTKVFREGRMGWGLKTLEDIKPGQLVMEYVGEVIDYDMVLKRLSDHKINKPNDHSMYIMQLGSNQYIDARFKGSVSRFINHSCDPNCELQLWKVNNLKKENKLINQINNDSRFQQFIKYTKNTTTTSNNNNNNNNNKDNLILNNERVHKSDSLTSWGDPLATSPAITSPLIFQCNECYVIIGDSFSFKGIDRDAKYLALVGASNIKISMLMEHDTNSSNSHIRYIYCNKCGNELGKIYLRTSNQLISCLNSFLFQINKIHTYQLGVNEREFDQTYLQQNNNINQLNSEHVNNILQANNNNKYHTNTINNTNTNTINNSNNSINNVNNEDIIKPLENKIKLLESSYNKILNKLTQIEILNEFK